MASPLITRLDTTACEQAQRHAIAILQHQRVMEEAAQVRKIAAQSRRLAAAQPVFAAPISYPRQVRSRVEWEQAS